jgi:hypothetical protein
MEVPFMRPGCAGRRNHWHTHNAKPAKPTRDTAESHYWSFQRSRPSLVDRGHRPYSETPTDEQYGRDR